MDHKINCQTITDKLVQFSGCSKTSDGLRVSTQCLYPSFDPVNVYIVGFGEGFKVHDGGGAARSAWDHGRDDATIRRSLAHQATSYHLSLIDDVLVADAADADWLVPAILCVANASASAAHHAIARVSASAEQILKEKIYDILMSAVETRRVGKDVEAFGRSGKKYHFDFGVQLSEDSRLLISAVSPHHVSISAKYVSFADTNEAVGHRGFAVYDKELEADDRALLQQVADLVPYRSLRAGITRELTQ